MSSVLSPRGKQAGFSLVELMVVIAIIGLLSTIVAVNVLQSGSRARVQKVQADVRALDDAIILYVQDTGQFPQGLEDLVQGSVDGWQGPYIRGGRRALLDPWNREYIYRYTGVGDPPYEIGSYGADGAPGGEGENAEIFPHAEY